MIVLQKKCINDRRRTRFLLFSRLVIISTAIVLVGGTSSTEQQHDASKTTHITANSTVLVTGAAGFLGSQVSLALLRLYSPKHLLLLDNFESTYLHDGSSSSPPFAGSAFTSAEYVAKFKRQYELHKTQQFLTLLEYKRQRMFTILQSCVTARKTTCKFYKADLRPTIPEYFDIGEIPLLNNIFEHYEITHVIHLANEESSRSKINKPPGRDMLQSTKAGITETMLEQLRKENRRRKLIGKLEVQYVFRSSYEVYSDVSDDDETTTATQNHGLRLRDEMDDITSPANLHGTYKRIDEILAKSYSDFVPSVGLRLFPVYGPWDSSQLFSSSATTTSSDSDAVPFISEGIGLDIFSLCERMVSLNPMEALIPFTNLDDQTIQQRQTEGKHLYRRLTRKHDWVYIDDAVDAILSAVQFPMASSSTTWPIIFNVGGGGNGGATTGTSIADIIHIMEQFYPRYSSQFQFKILMDRLVSSFGNDDGLPRGVLADKTRSKYFLNYEPRITVQDGIQRTLGWHHDRLHPYGLSIETSSEGDAEIITNYPPPETVISSGIAGCSPLDKECLGGSAVFPCVSECANPRVCLPSIYDNMISTTLEWTKGCSAVLYTVLLGKDATKEDLPNANAAVSARGRGFVEGYPNGGICNLAFVTEGSKMLTELEKSAKTKGKAHSLGIWTLVPVPHGKWSLATLLEDDDEIVSLFATQEAQLLIPKLSPGNFFADTVKYAVYVNPRVVISDVNSILELMSERPRGGGMAGTNSGTSMLLLQNSPANPEKSNPWERAEEELIPDIRGAQQESTYQSIQMGLHGQISLNIPHGVDSSAFVVHALQVEDARLFRCDVYAEVLQWESFRDGEAKPLEFVLGLHNLWSRLIMQWAGYHSWWEDEGLAQASIVDSAHGIDQILRENLESLNEGDVDGVITTTDDSVQAMKKTSAPTKEAIRSKWLAVLSSKATHQFVRIVPAEMGLVVKLDLP